MGGRPSQVHSPVLAAISSLVRDTLRHRDQTKSGEGERSHVTRAMNGNSRARAWSLCLALRCRPPPSPGGPKSAGALPQGTQTEKRQAKTRTTKQKVRRDQATEQMEIPPYRWRAKEIIEQHYNDCGTLIRIGELPTAAALARVERYCPATDCLESEGEDRGSRGAVGGTGGSITRSSEGYGTEEECVLSDPQGESDADADIEDTDCRLQEPGSLQRISSRRRKRPRPTRQDTTESEDDGGRSQRTPRWNPRLSPHRGHSRTILEESVSQVRPLVIRRPSAEVQTAGSPEASEAPSSAVALGPPLPPRLLLLLSSSSSPSPGPPAPLQTLGGA
ncbi:unnamed protein product [Gadus morhua 'NCC']